MFRFLAVTLTIMALTFLSGPWLPWWTIAPLAAGVCFLIRSRPMKALAQGVVAGGLLWGGLAFFRDQANDHLLSSQIGTLFQGVSPAVVIAITAVLGGLVAGLGALTGASLREVFQVRHSRL
ncbi:MAG: hypothetical protein IPJ06_13480 [Saprospiraceae bacterium]|nr:hypothetical protein [Saprospiraceae bacterium]